eukprot:5225433-Prymnesium_polylepis.1
MLLQPAVTPPPGDGSRTVAGSRLVDGSANPMTLIALQPSRPVGRWLGLERKGASATVSL